MRFHEEHRLLTEERVIRTDRPKPYVLRITLNRPHKRNALTPQMRAQLINELQLADKDPTVRVSIIRGDGKDFCAGYDVSFELGTHSESYNDQFESPGENQFQRAAVSTVAFVWDLRKPVICQVHGHCLAGGTEIATACDVVYVAEDAKIGYPPVRAMGLPDTQAFPWLCGMRQSMELMLSGQAMSGAEAHRTGWATRAVPGKDLEAFCVKMAETFAKVPEDLQQLNKRSVHRAMECMGIRTALRYGTELQQLSSLTEPSKEFMRKFLKDQLNPAVTASAFRFKVTGIRSGESPASVHMAKWKLRLKGRDIPLPKEYPALPLQGADTLTVTYKDKPVRIDSYSFVTASDRPELDPVTWEVRALTYQAPKRVTYQAPKRVTYQALTEDGWTLVAVKNVAFSTPHKRKWTTGPQSLDSATTRTFSERDEKFSDYRETKKSKL